MKRLTFALLPILAAISALGAEVKSTPRLLVPAYFYPAGEGKKEWETLFGSPDPGSIVAIMNPASGPGERADPNYVEIVKRAGQSHVMLIGYVTTGYGKRPLPEVQGEVDRWLRLYPGVRGIFFDEQASDEAHVDQATLYRYVRQAKKLDLVVTNPGTVCAEGYLSRPATDAACLFEGPYAAHSLDFPAWTKKYDPRRIVALPYKVATVEGMRECFRIAGSRGIGTLYVTDAEGVNPWDRLPRYWGQEAISKWPSP